MSSRKLLRIGEKSYNLTVLENIVIPGKDTIVRCLCACGKEKILRASHFFNGGIKSCGCLHNGQWNVKHGNNRVGKRTRTYRVWVNMKDRCLRKSCKGYSYYGGRGISVCDRWLDFTNFLEDMGECPEGYSIERKNNDGPYSPDNCVWDTMKNQNLNKRNNILVEYEGKVVPLSVVAASIPLSYATLLARIKKGWDVQTAIYAPLNYNFKTHGAYCEKL